MNIRYFGPIDGHDVKNLARVLRDIKDMQGPKILHLHTIKGKGFGPAEKHATEWHAPGKFDPVTGERFIANTEGMPPLFQDVFGNTLVELAEANPKIVGVTPAMPSGCSMNILMEKCRNVLSMSVLPKDMQLPSPEEWQKTGCNRSAISILLLCNGHMTISSTT